MSTDKIGKEEYVPTKSYCFSNPWMIIGGGGVNHPKNTASTILTAQYEVSSQKQIMVSLLSMHFIRGKWSSEEVLSIGFARISSKCVRQRSSE